MSNVSALVGSRVVILFFLMIILVTGSLACNSPQNASVVNEEEKMPIVLLTDFGSGDYRISQLKGIIYSNNPEAKVIDASHSVPAFDKYTGAFILDIAAKEFPEDVVFVAVIDPYTQPEIRYLVVTTDKNQHFVVPDNGLHTYVAINSGIRSVYQITNEELFDKPLNELSAERIQGITGALISSGVPPQEVGTLLDKPRLLSSQQSKVINDILLGTVIYIDHFGNCITNISEEAANDFGVKPGDSIHVRIKETEIPAKFGTIYSDVPQQEEIVFINNNLGTTQLSVNLGDFAEKFSIDVGTKIEIEILNGSI